MLQRQLPAGAAACMRVALLLEPQARSLLPVSTHQLRCWWLQHSMAHFSRAHALWVIDCCYVCRACKAAVRSVLYSCYALCIAVSSKLYNWWHCRIWVTVEGP